MKLSFAIFALFITINSFANTITPRDSFRTFLKAMVRIKENKSSETQNYKTAINTLDLSEIGADIKFAVGQKRSQQLIKVLDKIKKVKYDEIPLNPKSAIWYFDKRQFGGHFLEISLIKVKDNWLFSNSTLNALDNYELLLSSTKYIDGVKKLQGIADEIRAKAPPFLLERHFFFENWQVLGLLLILLISFIFEKVSKVIITYTINKTSKVVLATGSEMLSHAIDPFVKIIFVFVTMKLITIIDLNTATIAVINRILYIAMSLMTVWFAHKVIQFFSSYFAKKSKSTLSKFDDILVPLLTKTAFVIIYLLGGLLVANSLTIDVTGIIAGLGIGGLAFAFAAKDTLANFFGSIMLVLDRPFDIGDIIVAGDIEGIVTEVGFRSTRIRTFNDSLITIANGELMNRSIDNKGKRRFRRLVTSLGLEYDTPPVKIESFCEGVRQLIMSYKWTRKDNFHVYFDNYGDFSLNIKLVVYWETGDYSRELSEKHRLMIDILRLAEEIGVGFAFPTQTLHLFNEEKIETTPNPEKYFQSAVEKAKKVLAKPLSLKNPRSNAEDKTQFGDNDIGI